MEHIQEKQKQTMNNYMKVAFSLTPYDEMKCDILVSVLADYGFECFEPTGNGTNAYIVAADYDAAAVERAVEEASLDGVQVTWEAEEIKGVNWNEEWEKNYFKPMTIAGRCVIHSTFHTDYPKLEYEIVIDPKMAFGTGHHETTSLMVEQILREDLTGKSVIDMGTGTGILAILASMCGASVVTGIEIDEDAYLNAVDNLRLNGAENKVGLIHGDASALAGIDKADVLLANINRNIITADIARYRAALKDGGIMLLSGFYVEDIPVVMEAARPQDLQQVLHNEKNRWVMLKLTAE